MLMVVLMPMAVMLVAVALVIVTVFSRRLVGACVGLERRLDVGDLRAEPAHHVFQHMVAADADSVGQNLRLHMAIADVIRDPRKLADVAATHFRQLLGRSDNLDQAPALGAATPARTA